MLNRLRTGTLGVHYPELPDVSWYIPTYRGEVMGLGNFSIDDARKHMKEHGIDFTDYSSFSDLSDLGQEEELPRQLPQDISPEVLKAAQEHQAKKESIAIPLVLATTSALAVIYIVDALSREKRPVWRAVGITGMTGAGLGVIEGVSSILAHFAAKK